MAEEETAQAELAAENADEVGNTAEAKGSTDADQSSADASEPTTKKGETGNDQESAKPEPVNDQESAKPEPINDDAKGNKVAQSSEKKNKQLGAGAGSVKQIDGVLKPEFTRLSNRSASNWKDREEALLKLKELFQGDICKGAGFSKSIRKGIQPLLDQLNDHRHAIVKDCCEVLEAMAAGASGGESSDDMENVHADYVVPSLLQIVNSNNKIVGQASTNAMKAILTNCQGHRIANRLVDAAAPQQNAILRERSITFLQQVIEGWSDEKLAKLSQGIGKVLAPALNEGKRSLRSAARECMAAYKSKFPNSTGDVLASVDQHALKQLESVVPGATTEAAVAAKIAGDNAAANRSPVRRRKPRSSLETGDQNAGASGAQIEELEARVEEERNKRIEVDGKLAELKKSLSTERRLRANLQKASSEHQSTISKLQDQIKSMQSEASDADAQKKKLDAAERKSLKAKKRLGEISQENKSLQRELAEIKEELEAKSGHLERLKLAKGQHSELVQNVERERARADEAVSDLEGAKSRWASRENELFEIRGELEGNVTRLQMEMEALREQLAQSQSKLAEAQELQANARPASQPFKTPRLPLSTDEVPRPATGGKPSDHFGDGKNNANSHPDQKAARQAWGDELEAWGNELVQGSEGQPPVPNSNPEQGGWKQSAVPSGAVPSAAQGEPSLELEAKAAQVAKLQKQNASLVTELEESRASAALSSEELAELQRLMGRMEADHARALAAADKEKTELDWRGRMVAQQAQRLQFALQESEQRRARAEGYAQALLMDVKAGQKDSQIARDQLEVLSTQVDSILYEEASVVKALSGVKDRVSQLHRGVDKRLTAFDQAERRDAALQLPHLGNGNAVSSNGPQAGQGPSPPRKVKGKSVSPKAKRAPSLLGRGK